MGGFLSVLLLNSHLHVKLMYYLLSLGPNHEGNHG